jgi:hypothetical protein
MGAIVLYAVGRMLGGEPGSDDNGVANSPPIAEQRKQPNSVTTETPKPSPSTALSESNPAAGEETEHQTPGEGYPPRFVTGNRVAFRSGPSTGDGTIDRFDNGRPVLLIEASGQWSHVRDKLTQRDGWIASRFLAANPKARDEKPSKKEPKETAREKPVPSVPDSTIIQRIIAESLASYPSSCACPYNTDRRGRRCGNRSAYSKPGGYAPICYPQDVTKAMIDAFRRQ